MSSEEENQKINDVMGLSQETLSFSAPQLIKSLAKEEAELLRMLPRMKTWMYVSYAIAGGLLAHAFIEDGLLILQRLVLGAGAVLLYLNSGYAYARGLAHRVATIEYRRLIAFDMILAAVIERQDQEESSLRLTYTECAAEAVAQAITLTLEAQTKNADPE